MRFFSKCENCKKTKFLVKTRVFTHKITGNITSKSLLCGSCKRGIANIIKTM